MILNSERKTGRIICASILTGVLLVFGVCFASASTWNTSARFFSGNCLYTFINALKIVDSTAICGETSRIRLRDQIFSDSGFCAVASFNLKFFEGWSEITPYSGIAGTLFEKPKPNGADMVSRE